MALYAGTSFITNKQHYIHNSFEQTTENQQSYVGIVTYTPNIFTNQVGYSVAVGSGRVVIGVPDYFHTPLDVSIGAFLIRDLNGNNVGIVTNPRGLNESFGYSVAVGCGRIVVGTPFYDIGALPSAGAAYIYDLNGRYVGIITHPNADQNDQFGFSVAIGCGRIVVGSPYDRVYQPGNGEGSAHIYNLDGSYVGILTHPQMNRFDLFGYSVAVGSGRIVVGAPDKGSLISGVGSAYVYNLSGTLIADLKHSSQSANDAFGASVAVGCGKIVVGCPEDDFDAFTDAGSAHIYDLSGTFVGIVSDTTPTSSSLFGSSVSVGSGKIVVGCKNDNISAFAAAGSAHIYDLNATLVGVVTHPNASPVDQFGYSVAAGCDRVVVGSVSDDVGDFTDAGSVHIWEFSRNIDTYYEEIIDNYKY